MNRHGWRGSGGDGALRRTPVWVLFAAANLAPWAIVGLIVQADLGLRYSIGGGVFLMLVFGISAWVITAALAVLLKRWMSFGMMLAVVEGVAFVWNLGLSEGSGPIVFVALLSRLLDGTLRALVHADARSRSLPSDDAL